MSGDEWRLWFAWKPVEVDAYDPSEIEDGHTRYTVSMRWVERKWAPGVPENYESDQDAIPARWIYRPSRVAS